MEIGKMTVFGDGKESNAALDEIKSKVEKTNLEADETFKRFFSMPQPLSIIIKGVVPEFRDMDEKKIEMYIEVEFPEKEPSVEYDSTAKVLNLSSGTDSEATTVFDVYFKVTLPNKTSQRFALFIDLEMQQDFRPGYSIEKRSVYYPARMLSKQLTSLNDKKVYDTLQKVHSIWVFSSRYSKELANSVLSYSIRRTRTPDKLLESKAVHKIDSKVDLMDISYIFIDEELTEGDGVVEFLHACFYDKNKLLSNKKWIDTGNAKLREEANKMGNITKFYIDLVNRKEEEGEKRGEKKGDYKRVIAQIKSALARGKSDEEIMEDYLVSWKDLAEIKRLLGAYPDKTDVELAEIMVKELV